MFACEVVIWSKWSDERRGYWSMLELLNVASSVRTGHWLGICSSQFRCTHSEKIFKHFVMKITHVMQYEFIIIKRNKRDHFDKNRIGYETES